MRTALLFLLLCVSRAADPAEFLVCFAPAFSEESWACDKFDIAEHTCGDLHISFNKHRSNKK